jgi:four helix bundle protein
MARKYLTLDDIRAYKIASELSDYVWNAVLKWDWFAKKTLGAQLTTAVDSIAGNIAEGFGRYHKKDKIKFYYNARASVFESAHWIKKAFNRDLISSDVSNCILERLRILPREINHFIDLTDKKLSV